MVIGDLLGEGAAAETYAYGDGRVLKLYRERAEWHRMEVVATRAAHASGLPVPQVHGDLIDVGDRMGVILERVDGPTLSEHLCAHPDKAVALGRMVAELHAEMHSLEATAMPMPDYVPHEGDIDQTPADEAATGPEMVAMRPVLTWSIAQAESLSSGAKAEVLDILATLPAGRAVCHNDMHPHNIIMSPRGPILIDWEAGMCENPLTDFARSWLFSRVWTLDAQMPESHWPMWTTFWRTYLERYHQLRPAPEEELTQWMIVAATASLTWDGPRDWHPSREGFIDAALRGEAHPWTE